MVGGVAVGAAGAGGGNVPALPFNTSANDLPMLALLQLFSFDIGDGTLEKKYTRNRVNSSTSRSNGVTRSNRCSGQQDSSLPVHQEEPLETRRTRDTHTLQIDTGGARSRSRHLAYENASTQGSRPRHKQTCRRGEIRTSLVKDPGARACGQRRPRPLVPTPHPANRARGMTTNRARRRKSENNNERSKLTFTNGVSRSILCTHYMYCVY